MTPEKLRKNLLALRERLTNEQTTIKRDSLNSDSARLTARAPINMAEQASDEQALDLMVSRLNASTQTLSAIDEALGRLEAGHFNVCEECRGEVGLRRLDVQPWARLCVACQREFEEGRL